MSGNLTVWAKITRPGFHRWPNATPRRDYLAQRHRHLFHVAAEVRVGHDDRAIEFHDLQDIIFDWWPGPELGDLSCEALARGLADTLTDQGFTPTQVDVGEDGECGATLRLGAP